MPDTFSLEEAVPQSTTAPDTFPIEAAVPKRDTPDTFSLEDAVSIAKLPAAFQPDPYQQAVMSGRNRDMEAGNADFLTALASDPTGFLKSLPSDAASLAEQAGAAVGNVLPALHRMATGTDYSGRQPVVGVIRKNASGQDELVSQPEPLPFQPGESPIPSNASAMNPEGSDANRLLRGATTPGNLLLAPFAAAKPVQAYFAAQSAAGAADAADRLLNSPDGRRAAAQDLLLNGAMAWGIGAHLGETPATTKAKALAGVLNESRPDVPTREAMPLREAAAPPPPPDYFSLDQATRPISEAAEVPSETAKAGTESISSQPESHPGNSGIASEPPAGPSSSADTEFALMPVDVSEQDIKAMQGPMSERPPDLLDTIGDHWPGGVKFEGQDYGDYMVSAKGAAKNLMSGSKGEPADVVLDQLRLMGEGLDMTSVDDLAQAMVEAGDARKGASGQAQFQARALAEMKARDDAFTDANQPRKGAVPLPAEQMVLGDVVRFKGQPMRVTGFDMDPESGKPTGVELTGAFGKQLVPAGRSVHVDEGSLQVDQPGRVAASGTSTPRPSKPEPVHAPGFQAGMEAKDITPLRQQAKAFMESLRGQSLPNDDTGIPLLIDRTGAREIISKFRRPEELHVLSALPELVRRAEWVKSNPEDTGKPGIKAWHYYTVPTELAGKVHDVTLVARELEDGRRLYDSYIMQEKGPVAKAGAASRKTLGNPTATDPNNNSTASGRVNSAGSGTPRPPRKTALAVPPQIATTPAPPVGPLRAWLSQHVNAIKSGVAPQTISPMARDVGNSIRHFLGQNALAIARADEALSTWRKEFDKTPVSRRWQYNPAEPLPHNYAIIDALERDPASLPQRYQDLARTFQHEFQWRIAEIQKYAPNALQHLIQNYFPHVWEDPKRATEVMAQTATRLMAGRKEFLKQRTLPMFLDGPRMQLSPIHSRVCWLSGERAVP